MSAPRDVLVLGGQGESWLRKRTTLAACALGLVVFLGAMVMWRVIVALSP